VNLPKPFLNVQYDTLKIYFRRGGFKPNNLVINLDNDDWVLHDDKKLTDYNIDNETEISLYNLEDYVKFKANPEIKW